ncbi:MAG: hypothetical protein ACMG57_04390 [Candidatus Dojkabacteria bacterium]
MQPESIDNPEYPFTRNTIINGMLDLLKEANEGNKPPGARGEIISLMRSIMVKVSVKLERTRPGKEVLYNSRSAALIMFSIRRALIEKEGSELRIKFINDYPIVRENYFWENLAKKLNILEEYGTLSIEI